MFTYINIIIGITGRTNMDAKTSPAKYSIVLAAFFPLADILKYILSGLEGSYNEIYDRYCLSISEDLFICGLTEIKIS